MFTIEIFLKGLNELTYGCSFEIVDNELIMRATDTYFFRNQNSGENVFKYNLDKVKQNLLALQNVDFESYSVVQDHSDFETAIDFLKRDVPPFRYYEKEHYVVEEHGYKMYIAKASELYLTALICKVGAEENVDIGWRRSFHFNYHYLTREGSDPDTLFDSFRVLTVRIQTPVHMSLSQFNKMLSSYLYNISYNYDVAFTKKDFNEERHRFHKRISREGQLFPYKSFNGELVKYYYQALTADMPITQYLAYYHVAEYFFQQIAESEAFTAIEHMLTHPSFSPYKKGEIRRFYDNIKRIMRTQRDDGLWDEKNGLLSCIKKFVPDLDELKCSINAIDSNVIAYYQENAPAFASLDESYSDENVTIDFSAASEKVYKAIRNRVYLVRNAIAHSKEGERLRYEPFRHDKELQKEIPLIRAIAEEIIINSAKPLEIEYSSS